MLYKKSALGRKYIRVVTSSPSLFIFFIIIGVILFFSLALTTRIDVIKTYSATLSPDTCEVTLSSSISNIPEGPAYIYVNKNDEVFSISIEKTVMKQEGLAIYTNTEGERMIKLLSSNTFFIDIPQGKETLLYRIFAKGGKGYA